MTCPEMGLHKKTYKMAKRRNVGRSRRTFTETDPSWNGFTQKN